MEVMKGVLEMSNAKKNVSMRIDEKYVKALDILTEHAPEHLPIENRSLLLSYLLKSFLYQIVNDKATFVGDNAELKEELDKIGINKDTLVMLDNLETLRFCEETKNDDNHTSVGTIGIKE